MITIVIVINIINNNQIDKEVINLTDDKVIMIIMMNYN